MGTTLMRGKVSSILLVGSTLTAMLAGSATAQRSPTDNPPGSQFENQGERLEQGQRATPSQFSRTAKHAREVSSKASDRGSTHRKHRKTQHSQ
jgi:hypothetical protein